MCAAAQVKRDTESIPYTMGQAGMGLEFYQLVSTQAVAQNPTSYKIISSSLFLRHNSKPQVSWKARSQDSVTNLNQHHE